MSLSLCLYHFFIGQNTVSMAIGSAVTCKYSLSKVCSFFFPFLATFEAAVERLADTELTSEVPSSSDEENSRCLVAKPKRYLDEEEDVYTQAQKKGERGRAWRRSVSASHEPFGPHMFQVCMVYIGKLGPTNS